MKSSNMSLQLVLETEELRKYLCGHDMKVTLGPVNRLFYAGAMTKDAHRGQYG